MFVFWVVFDSVWMGLYGVFFVDVYDVIEVIFQGCMVV